MRAKLFLIILSFFTFSNLFAQCPGAMAQTYKNKALNVTSGNTEEGGAYAGMATYYAYKCECENGTNRNPAQLVSMINSLVDVNVQKYQNRYGTISKVNSCKEAGSGANGSENSNTTNTTNNTNELGLSESEWIILNNLADSAAIEIANLLERKKEIKEAETAKLVSEAKNYLIKLDRIKDFQNADGSYISQNAFSYGVDFNDNNWVKKENEYIETNLLKKNILEVTYVKDLDFKDLRTNDQHFLVFENKDFNVGKDFEVSFEYGYNIKQEKFYKHIPLNLFISNNTVIRIGNLFAYLNTSFTPYTNLSYFFSNQGSQSKLFNNNPELRKSTLSMAVRAVPLNIYNQLPEKIFISNYNESEEEIIYGYYKKERKEKSYKVLNKKAKKIPEKELWIYNKVRIVKTGESITLFYEILDENMEKTERRSIYFPFKYINENKIFFGLNVFLMEDVKNVKFRIKDFTIKQ